MLLKAPLLFIDGPPMVTAVRVEKEESTSIYWSGTQAPAEDSEAEQPGGEETSGQPAEDTDLMRKIRYLAEPFPRTAYQPLQFLVGGQLLTGGIVSIAGSEVAVKVTEESQSLEEIRTFSLREIEEVYWKGRPFR